MTEVSSCMVSFARKIAKISDFLRPATGPYFKIFLNCITGSETGRIWCGI
jgi:hypothetical protein